MTWMLMWLNWNVAIINAMLQLLNIYRIQIVVQQCAEVIIYQFFFPHFVIKYHHLCLSNLIYGFHQLFPQCRIISSQLNKNSSLNSRGESSSQYHPVKSTIKHYSSLALEYLLWQILSFVLSLITCLVSILLFEIYLSQE